MGPMGLLMARVARCGWVRGEVGCWGWWGWGLWVLWGLWFCCRGIGEVRGMFFMILYVLVFSWGGGVSIYVGGFV